ncbi:TetR/AcrR family transcriptional regulator [Nitrospirillum sp. BR 11163]|uniref:TetR/AcrR family transcriptional regulator n=1 Tax=Nitrospirillum sp. BR 11163 TaxID=3104323 RepID=UPI002AFF1583|nr:TetR/AcrR family transcriptional regulator [Nitrospirillum sp. BR 11163]MEA1672986.1 TetR/AcrR family transcriptional regulator [Nitrospirillum sp. BR 11163]
MARSPEAAKRAAGDGETDAMTQGGVGEGPETEAAPGESAADKTPRTERGKRTLRKLLDAAALEFGERGFHEASVSGITQRAAVALGTFYTYFDSKELLFRALVEDMGALTRRWIAERVAHAPDRLTAERLGLEAFIEFVRAHRNLYRIVMEAQFVAEDAYRRYYQVFADGYINNLESAKKRGEIRQGDVEVRAWALIGVSVFIGQRYAVWGDDRPAAEVAAEAADFIARGLKP